MDTLENDNTFLNELKKITPSNPVEKNALDKLKDLKKDTIKPQNTTIENNTDFKKDQPTTIKINENQIKNNNTSNENKIKINQIKTNENQIKNNNTSNENKIKINQIKTNENQIKTNEQKINELLNKTNNLPIKEPEKELTLSKFLKENYPQKNEKFSWQNKSINIEPKPFEQYIDVDPEIDKALEKQRSTMEFEWEKHEPIEEPNEKDFTNYDWLKKEILEGKKTITSTSTNKTPFAEKTIQPKAIITDYKTNIPNQKTALTKTSTEFDWENYDDIEQPSETDFTIETINHKWKTQLNKTNSNINDPIITAPKWKHNAENKNKDQSETKQEPQTNQKEPIINNTKTNQNGPKWKHHTENENKPETKQEPQTNQKEPIINNTATNQNGPKWKHHTENKNKTEEKEIPKTQNDTKKIIPPKEETNQTNDNLEIKVTPWKHHTENKNKTEEKEIPKTQNDTKKEITLVKKTQTENMPSKQETIVNENNQEVKTPPWKHHTQPQTEEIPQTTTENFDEEKINPLPKNITSKIKLDVIENLKTPIDELFALLESFKVVDTAEVANHVGLEYYEIETIAKTFEDYGIVEIKYPTSLKAKPKIYLKKRVAPTTRAVPKGEILDKYQISADGVPAEISIIMTTNEARPIYAINLPSIGRYTKQFLTFLKNEIAEDMPIELDEIMDPKKSKALKKRFFNESQKHLKKYFRTSSKEVLDVLSGVVLHEMYGLGAIEVILSDDMLEEVTINSSKTPITIYHRIHGWLKTNLFPGNEEDILNYSSQIGRKVGREITTLSPILDAHLLSGDRVNATLFPITAEGNTLTIRRFARKPWTLIDFIGKAHTMSSEMAAVLWLAMQYEMNILIAGGTASGKTSTLNTLLSLVPSYHRIISIEDVREIILPIYLNWNWIPMITRSANPEGLGEVTMLDCMVSSLRMRPDRIIVGEVRRHKEAEVLMEAIETGHSIYSTIHANSAYQVLRRLAEPPMSIPVMQIELLDLIVVQFRDRKTNKRRTFEIAEIEQTSTGKGLQINTIYKWMPRTDEWEQLNKPNKLLTLLNLHTGLTEDEIYKELHTREKILDWMKEKGISELNTIGFIIKMFYINPDKVKQHSINKTSREEIEKLMQESEENI
jgi:archaeal flagellar protein FlaI